MPAQEGHDLSAFVAALKDGDLFARAGRGFALLAPGDWEGLRRWARSHGFAFTLRELLAYCEGNPHILDRMSDSPRLSDWGLQGLKQAAGA